MPVFSHKDMVELYQRGVSEAQRQAFWDQSPSQAMMAEAAARRGLHAGQQEILPLQSFYTPLAPQLESTSQEPRQWNLVTVKRAVVTRAEFRFYGSVEAVLKQKGFPNHAPENGMILLSWFDQQEGTAYYELARVQDTGEMLKYMQEKFHPPVEEGMERMVEFREE